MAKKSKQVAPGNLDGTSAGDLQFRDLLMQTPVGITILRGPDLVVEMANETYLHIIDRNSEDFIGRPLFEVMPEVREMVEPLLMNVMATGKPYTGNEFKVNVHRHGKTEVTYFNFIYKPLKNAAGILDGIIVVANEVTSLVESRFKVSDSAAAFRQMIVQSPIPVTIFRGEDFVIELANIAMLRDIWRRKEEDVIGHKLLQVFPELTDQKYPEILRRGFATGEAFSEKESIAYIQGDDGMRKFYLDYEYTPLCEPDGTVSGMMLTVNDVTASVESRQRLEDAEARLRMAAEGTGLATWDLDLRNYHIIYSPRLNEIFGHAIDKVLTHATMREQIHPDDRHEVVEAAFDRAILTGVYDYEARVIKPDQTISWIRTQGKVIFDEQRKPLRILGTLRDITIQRNIQKAIEESENRLNIAIVSAELGTWELNIKTRDAVYSARYLEILGFAPNEKPNHAQLLSRIHPEDVEKRNAATLAALKSGTLDMEIRVVPFGDERYRWIRARGKVFYDDAGNPERMLGTIMDITEQKHSLELIKESEERFRTIANTAPVMIWMSGDDRFSDFFNTSWLQFTGRKIEQETGEGWLESVYPDDVPVCTKAYNDAFAARQPFYVEYRLKRYDGQYRWIADNAVPRYDSTGRFLGFISACMDIDDEKRFNQRLQASELLFKTISNVSPVALWMTNERGENNFVNETWINWTGIPLEEQFNHGWLVPLLEADRDVTARQYMAKSQHREKFTAEFRFRRVDGSIRWGLSEGFPYYDNEGVFAGYAGSVADITERKQDELLKNEFLAVASHELKTPITSIKAYTQLLASTYEKSDDAFLKNALSKVENQVNKMTKLVADFLNLSKIESDKFKPEKELFQLDILVQEVVADHQLVAASHHIRIDEVVPVKVNADRDKIFQVITNFLTNAVKYSPGEKEIVVSMKRHNGEVEVTVHDNGIGIPKGEHEKIFQRFYRAGSNNIRFSGFGIGLYISAEIMRMHDGQIGVTSEEGKGAKFYFKLPVAG